MKPSTLEPKLTIKQLAERWGWKEDTVRDLVRGKMIPHLRIPGSRAKGKGRIYFEASEVEEWLEGRRRREQVGQESHRSGRSVAEEREALGLPRHHMFDPR